MYYTDREDIDKEVLDILSVLDGRGCLPEIDDKFQEEIIQEIQDIINGVKIKLNGKIGKLNNSGTINFR